LIETFSAPAQRQRSRFSLFFSSLSSLVISSLLLMDRKLYARRTRQSAFGAQIARVGGFV
jgi:hypothetical protein